MAKKTIVSLMDKFINAFFPAETASYDDVKEGMVSCPTNVSSPFGWTRINGRLCHAAEAFCVNCSRRYYLTWDCDDLLIEVECKKCGEKGGLILTGQPFKAIGKRVKESEKGGIADDGEH